MHKGSLKKWALALTFWLALHTASLKAQIFTNDLPLQAVTTGTNPVDFEFRADGTMIAKGNFGVGSLTTGDQGAGTRMLWFPSMGAFRAGTVNDSYKGNIFWDADNIGNYSVAFGLNNTASGVYSTASGNYNLASGEGATAFGESNLASGPGAVAMGENLQASSITSTAFGYYNAAAGWRTTVSGQYNAAVGGCSTVFGSCNTATGLYSTASGYYTTAAAQLSFVVGCYNTGLNSEGGAANTDYWVGIDPLFEVGNGGAPGNDGNPLINGTSDAFVVYKNGNAALQGVLQVAPGGDIPMYTGE